MLTINQPLPAPVRLVEFLTNRIDAAPALLLMRSGPAWHRPAVPCAAPLATSIGLSPLSSEATAAGASEHEPEVAGVGLVPRRLCELGTRRSV